MKMHETLMSSNAERHRTQSNAVSRLKLFTARDSSRRKNVNVSPILASYRGPIAVIDPQLSISHDF